MHTGYRRYVCASCGGIWFSAKYRQNDTTTTEPPIEKSNISIRNVALLLASWWPAVAWPAAAPLAGRLAGWPQAGPPANQLADGGEKQLSGGTVCLCLTDIVDRFLGGLCLSMGLPGKRD